MRHLLLASAVLLIGVHAASASVIYDNFDHGDTYNTTSGDSVSLFFNLGVQFTPSAATMPTDVYVAMKSSATTNIVLSICAAANTAGALPGPVLFITTIVVTGGDPQVYHAMFTPPSTLAPGTSYWLTAVPGSGGGSATWMLNTAGQTGYATTLGGGAWNPAGGVTPVLRLEDNSAASLLGACCSGVTCQVTLPTACNALNTRFVGSGTSCNAPGNTTTPCCRADFNQNTTVNVTDIFAFLSAWFAGSSQADSNGDGLSVQDIFQFLSAWFTGC